jgi:hypothetical protein
LLLHQVEDKKKEIEDKKKEIEVKKKMVLSGVL